MNFKNSTFKASLASFKESISRIFVASALEPLNLCSWLFQLLLGTCKCLSSGLNGVRWFARRRSRRTRWRPRTEEKHLFIQFRRQKFILSSINQRRVKKERCREASKQSSTSDLSFRTNLQPSDYCFRARNWSTNAFQLILLACSRPLKFSIVLPVIAANAVSKRTQAAPTATAAAATDGVPLSSIRLTKLRI